MMRWRWLVAIVASAQLAWGIVKLIEAAREVGAPAGASDGWVFSALGLLGLLVLVLPRLGFPVAAIQGLVAAYALCWLPAAVLFLRTPPGLLLPPPFGMPPLALLIALTASTTALLCLLAAVGTWKVARQARRTA